MKKLFFISYGGGHINMMLPVLRELLRAGGCRVKLLALNTAIPVAAGSGVPFTTLNAYLPLFPEESEICATGARLAEEHHNSASGFPFEESVAYLGLSMHDLAGRVGESEAMERFRRQGRDAFLPVSVMERILDAESPDLIVISVSRRMEEAAVLAGNQRGIPTVMIHDFLVPGRNHSAARYHFVMTEQTRQQVVARGAPENTVYVLGQPAFDYLLDPIQTGKPELCAELGLDPSRSIVFWAVTPTQFRGYAVAELVLDAINRNPQVQFIIKLHPGEEDPAYFQRFMERVEHSNAILLHFYENRKLLAVSDLMYVEASTLGVEAGIAGVDMIEIQPSGCTNEIHYSDYGIAKLAVSSEELAALTEDLLKRGLYREELGQGRNRFLAGRQRSAPRVAEQLLRLCGGPAR